MNRQLTEEEHKKFEGDLNEFGQALLAQCRERDPSVNLSFSVMNGSPVFHIHQGPCTSHWRVWMEEVECELQAQFERVYF